MKKALLISTGFISLFMGTIGIIIPGLPTTPFLLLSAYLFLKSSDRMYNILLNHKVLGAYIKSFNQNGLNKKKRVISISIMWIMIIISVVFFISTFYVKLIVVVVGITGTISMALY